MSMSLPDANLLLTNFPLTLAVAAIFLLAGLVKGVIGMGLPTLAMGLLGLLMLPAQAAALLVMPSTATNVWQGFAGVATLALIRRLWLMLLMQVIGVCVSASLLVSGRTAAVGLMLGAVLLVYSVSSLLAWQPRVRKSREPVASFAAGLITGLIAGATGIMVMPAAPYLQALGLEKNELVQALGLSFTVTTVAIGVMLHRAGYFSGELSWLVLLAMLAVVLGMVLGRRLRGRLSTPQFRRTFLIGVGGIGLALAVRSIAVLTH